MSRPVSLRSGEGDDQQEKKNEDRVFHDISLVWSRVWFKLDKSSRKAFCSYARTAIMIFSASLWKKSTELHKLTLIITLPAEDCAFIKSMLQL